jgi:hypothetical protein
LPSAFTEGSAHSGRPGALAGGALSRSVAFDRRGRAPARPNFRATPAPPASEPAVPAGRENARGSGALGGGVLLPIAGRGRRQFDRRGNRPGWTPQ